MADDIELIKHMHKLDVHDGDVIVVAVKQSMEASEYERMSRLLKRVIELLGVRAEFIIVDGECIDIGVMRAAKEGS